MTAPPPPPGRAPGGSSPASESAADRLVVGLLDTGDAAQFPILSPSARMLWTPVLGPSAYLAAARITDLIEVGELLDIDLRSFGAALGLSASDRHGRSTIANALSRLTRFGVATSTPSGLLVHTHWGPAPAEARLKVQDASIRCRLIPLDNTPESVI